MAEKTLIYPADLSEQTSGEVPVPEFISRMYAGAEERKAPDKGGWVDGGKEYRMLLSRLEAIEEALDAHPQKHGWIWQ